MNIASRAKHDMSTGQPSVEVAQSTSSGPLATIRPSDPRPVIINIPATPPPADTPATLEYLKAGGDYAWPIFFLLLIAFYRRRISALLENLSEFEGFGFKVKLDRAILKLAGTSDPTPSEGAIQSDSDAEVPIPPSPQPVTWSPIDAVVEAFRPVESLVATLFAAIPDKGSIGHPSPFETPGRDISFLRNAGWIDDNLADRLRQALAIRNKVMGGEAKLSSDAAKVYALTTQLIIRDLKLVGNRHGIELI